MFTRPLSVFVSYSHLDDAVRNRLEAHLTSLRREGAMREWHDRRITAGSDWAGAIDEHLRAADIVLLLISPNFMQSSYCVDLEATEAIKRHLAGESRVIPVIVSPVDWKRMPIGNAGVAPAGDRPGTSLGMLNALPRDGKPLTDSREWASEDAAFLDVAEGLRKLINELAPEAPPTVKTAPAIVTGGSGQSLGRETKAPDHADAAVSLLSKLSRLDNLTYFLGSRFAAPDARSASGPADIARHLLGDTGMNLIDGSWDKLLPSLDSIGSYYSVAYGAALLEAEVLGLIAQHSTAVPVEHDLLAELLAHNDRQARGLARTQLRPFERKPQLVVSTNVDLMMERAFLRAGVSFTRIVQHLTEPKLTVTEFRELSEIPGDGLPSGRRLIRAVGPQSEATGPLECDPDDLGQVDQLLASFEPREITPRGATHLDTMGNQNPLESLALKRLRAPILYKLLGSQDVRMSCALSTEQYLDFCVRLSGRFVPTQIREIVAQTPVVCFGYGFLDPDFRLVYHTFEDALVERQTNAYPIYAVQLPPSQAPNDNYRRMEIGIWDRLKELGPRKARITTLEGSAESFLRKLLLPFYPERRDVA